MTSSSLAVAGLLLLVSPPAGPRGAAPASARALPAPAVVPAFEELWAAFVKADEAGDEPRAASALAELRRARVERNVRSLDTIGLALVARGVARLDAGQRDEAEQAFRIAVDLAPGLPDGHAGLAVALLKKGPLGVVPSVRAALAGLSAHLPTVRGAARARDLLAAAGLLAAFAVAWAVGVALLARHGGLLHHDIEEWLGPAQGRSASLALLLLLLLLPVATFQGWGWLPLWWMALLFAYLDHRERILAFLLVASTLAVGPLVWSLETRLRTGRDALYGAALATVESAPDRGTIARLEEAVRSEPSDRDLVYLLGAARRRAGRYEEAAELYRRVLAAAPDDAVARTNLANIEFARGAYESARVRYRAGTGPGAAPEVAATSFYNLSLVHLQKFEYQAYNEAKSNADRLAPGLVADYERWKYDTGDYAVVDLGPGGEDVRRKFAGKEESPLVAALLTRFTASLTVLVLVGLLVRRWRGRKAFTLHCGRCDTPFCRLCHLGQVTGGLCSQCYHLFVVRDGVSLPARNRKMAEVQDAEARRGRVFRVLSVLSPGTGQIYCGWTFRGALLVLAWYAVLALLAAGRVVPLTDVPRRLVPPWPAVAAGLLLLATWAVANRFRPERETGLPLRPSGPRRARPAPVAG